MTRSIEGMQELLQRSLGPMTAVHRETPERDFAAYADPTQLEMAMLNLGINARDAMPDGGTITITLEARRLEDDPELPSGDYVLVCVRDTGTGMTPEVAQRAFEPFFSTKGLGKGTGLGLSQVYAMARQSGGTVRIDTHPGQGTTVCVFLRRTEHAVEYRLAAAAGAEKAGATPGAPSSSSTTTIRCAGPSWPCSRSRATMSSRPATDTTACRPWLRDPT